MVFKLYFSHLEIHPNYIVNTLYLADKLIADIKKLRDEIAPRTLLTINGDIRDRQHGMELVAQYGVDGVMIGRGIFHNPYAFQKINDSSTETASAKKNLELLLLQLDLHDTYHAVQPRKFDPLKRFFKIYVRDFPNAAELRDTMMHAKSTDEVRAIIASISTS
mgnify:CR=1 FL=1